MREALLFKMRYFAQVKMNKFGFLTLNNCADLSFNTFSTLKTMKIYAWFTVVLENCAHYRVVIWYNGRFYVAELSFKT